MSEELKQIMRQADTFAREHVCELAGEIIEWQDTSILRKGKLRQLASTLRIADGLNSLKLAESMVVRAALERVATIDVTVGSRE